MPGPNAAAAKAVAETVKAAAVNNSETEGYGARRASGAAWEDAAMTLAGDPARQALLAAGLPWSM